MQKMVKNSVATMSALTLAMLAAGCSSFSSLNPFGGDAPRNPPAALVDLKPSMAIKNAWTYSIGSAGTYSFSPAVAGDFVFIAAADGSLAKLDAATGKPVWRINVGKKLTGGVGVSIAGDVVTVAAEKGQILVFDGNGKARWTAQASSEVLAPPAIGEGLVAVRSQDNKVQAFDLESGARRWQVQRIAPPLTLRTPSGIVIDSGVVYVAMPGGRLLALAANNGGARWEVAVGEPRGATELERVTDLAGIPQIAGREICAVSYQGKLACFDKTTGAPRWNKEMSSDVAVGMDERFVFAADEKGAVSAFSRDGGRSVWRNDKLANRRLSAPISFGRAVAVGDFQGQIHFMSREDGAFLARVASDGSQIIGMPTVAGANLVLQTHNGAVVALTAQ